MSGGFFRGTSADQDTRFSNKQAKLMKSQKFPAELEHLVDMSKVKMDVMRPWIANRVTELLGFEDEVLINFIYGLLDVKVINGKEVQIALTGFMEKNTGKFMKELWTLLLSAEKNASGVPQPFLDAKEEETRKKKVETDRIANEIQKKKDKEKEEREFEKERSRKMEGETDLLRSNNVASEPSSKHQLKSSVHGENEKGANGRNGSRARNRESSSPHSADRSSLSPRNRRSRSKSISNSRSYSGGRRKSKSPSESPQPRRGSLSSRSVSHSPRRRSLSPRRRPSPRRYTSPSRHRYVRHRSRSPIRRSLRSPIKRRSRTPIRRRFRSPVRRRSRSPVSRRSRSPVSRSPVRRRSRSPVSRSPIRRRSPSPVRRRSPISVRRPSPSPVRRRRSPSPMRRRYQRSPFSPRRRSPSPTRRSPISRRRSPISRRHRSPSPEELNSPSPVRRLPPSPGRRYAPVRHRSPMLSPRERIRHHEKRSPVRHARRREDDENSDESPKAADSLLHQPPTSMRSPQRDPRDLGVISKRKSSSSPSPRRSPSRSESPLASRRRSPSSDRRSFSPLANRQTKGLKSQDVNASSPGKTKDQKIHHDSPKVSEQEKSTHYDRDNRDQKRKPSGKRSEYSSAVHEPKDLLVSGKDAYSPERVGGLTSTELPSGHDGEIRIKDQERRRKNTYGRVSEVSDEKELQTTQKDSSVGERERMYPEKAYIDDEKTRSRSNEGKGRKRLLEGEITLKSTEKDEKKVRSGSLSSSSLESDKHREKRKHKRSKRREDASMDSYDSEIDDRKDAKKRKEEKRLRKEERRRCREERRRRREERRADKKLKTKSMDKNSPSSDYEMQRDGDASDGERNVKMLSGASDAEEGESEQKKLEIELRKKALESLKAKKGISR